MGDAKQIIVKPISSADANRIIRALHYSGKVVNNSQLHLGVFFNGKVGGAMQFGPSLDKRKIVGLVRGTLWNEFLELNRLAFADWLPRNGESRAIAYAMRFIKKNLPLDEVDRFICRWDAVRGRNNIPGERVFLDRPQSKQPDMGGTER